MKPQTLTAILAATTIGLSGCNATMGSKRPTIADSAYTNSTSLEYFATSAQKKTALDAAETDREARCLKQMYGIGYPDQKVFYNKLSACVGEQRSKDMAMYLPLAIVVDGIKLWGLFGGVNNASKTISGNNQTTYTVGEGTTNRVIGNVTH